MKNSLKVLAVAVLSAMVGACSANNVASSNNSTANQSVSAKDVKFLYFPRLNFN